jgi:hypothetical protein
MKISLISGISKRQVSTAGPSNLIGSLNWAERAGVNLSLGQKAEIRVKQFNPLISTARGIVRELISGNRGGIADMLYAISPFNTTGKIDQGLKSQYTAALAELKRTADIKFPKTKKTFSSPAQFAAEFAKWKPRNLTKPSSDFSFVENDNFVKNKAFVTAGLPDINKKFPFIIYPAATEAGKAKYREFEMMWLNYGGDVDSINAAVKEGATKSPRNKTFNYLLGKFAAKRYFPKDIGLAIRAVVGAAMGGDRFSFTDSDVFNPWKKQYGSGNIGNVEYNGLQGTGLETAPVAASVAWWVPMLESCAVILTTGLVGWAFSSGENNDPPAQVGGGPKTGGGAGGENDLSGMLLPVGAAVAAYFLFFSDDNK